MEVRKKEEEREELLPQRGSKAAGEFNWFQGWLPLPSILKPQLVQDTTTKVLTRFPFKTKNKNQRSKRAMNVERERLEKKVKEMP